MKETTIQRIRLMELYYDTVRAAMKFDSNFKKNPHITYMVQMLLDYMGNGTWLSDYQYDEMGHLPENLKRGVLSEDGLYNLISDIEEN